jgi:thiol-disulfide isomerase/thioredoxin
MALLGVTLVVGACSASSDSPADDIATGSEAWRTATLRDVTTGEDFRIADLEGKVVAIEAMAIWCSTCRIQQLEAQAALAEVDSPDVVYLSLDIDPNERADELAEYARREGFDWRFVVASREVARSLVASFGDQVLSAPATPVIVLGPDGAVVDQHFGIKGAGELAALFEEQLP